MAIGGQVMSGISQSAQGSAQASLARAEAMQERDTAAQEAQMIMRAVRRQQGAARAATAASGARIDEFSMGAEDEIGQLGAQDAAMTILTGNRRAAGLEFRADTARRAGRNEATASLFRATAYGISGWKGSKGPVNTTNPFYDGTTGDFAFGG
jgi:hypothetical protein